MFLCATAYHFEAAGAIVAVERRLTQSTGRRVCPIDCSPMVVDPYRCRDDVHESARLEGATAQMQCRMPRLLMPFVKATHIYLDLAID